MKARKLTAEHKRKISEAHRGMKKPWARTRNQKNKGKLSPRWKGGITSLNVNIRNSEKSKKWTQKVLWRDKYSCVKCGNKKGLQADHIKPFSVFPELRFKLSNGQCLCIKCHKIKTKDDLKIIKLAFNKNYDN